MKIYLMNTTILTSPGIWEMKSISLAEAKKIIQDNVEIVVSAIGHESTAKLLTNVLQIDVPVNRIQARQGTEDIAICFKLNGRIQEGMVLDLETIKKIGYEFFKIRHY